MELPDTLPPTAPDLQYFRQASEAREKINRTGIYTSDKLNPYALKLIELWR